jgi:hypothetical protein
LTHNFFDRFNERSFDKFDTQSYSLKDVLSKSQYNQSLGSRKKKTRAVTNQQFQRKKIEIDNPIEA